MLFVSLGLPSEVEKPTEDPNVTGRGALPDEERRVGSFNRQARLCLIAGGEGVDGELGPQRRPVRREGPPADVMKVRGARETAPGGYELSVGRNGEGRLGLNSRRKLVELDIVAHRLPGGVEEPGKEVAIAEAGEVVPGDPESAVGCSRNGWGLLRAGDIGVDDEGATHRGILEVEAPGHDSETRSVLSFPDQDQISCGVRGDPRELVRLRAIDDDRTACGCSRARETPVGDGADRARRPANLPRDDERSVGRRCYVRLVDAFEGRSRCSFGDQNFARDRQPIFDQTGDDRAALAARLQRARPDNGKARTAKPRDRRSLLRTERESVQLLLGAEPCKAVVRGRRRDAGE